jgi:thiol-disulfide isomerase/thioredoxin
MCRGFYITAGMIIVLVLASCSTETVESKLPKLPVDPIVTFIELGSVRCIPCKKMQPVMASIEKKYGGQIKVVFYDVWEADQKHYASQYDIKLIPTQIFLDSTGSEFMRHEGYFPEADIDSLFVRYGLIANPVMDK